MRVALGIVVLGISLWCGSAVYAQTAGSGQNQADILKLLSELPPETMKKVEALSKILQQNLREGKLTDQQLHEELMSGDLNQKLRTLNPEAGPLLDDIGSAMKNHPHGDSLPNLLDGMLGAGR